MLFVLILQFFFSFSKYFQILIILFLISCIFVCRDWFWAFNSMLYFAIIFFIPCSFSSIVLSFCICCFLFDADLIGILLKFALRKAFLTSSAASLSCLSFRISVSYLLFYFLVHSWIFCKFYYFASTSVRFSPYCSYFLRSLVATSNCFCSLLSLLFLQV